jgi:hypothetical protein
VLDTARIVRVARPLHCTLSTWQKAENMKTKSKVVGWLCVGNDADRVLVREESGELSEQAASAEGSFGCFAVQTGTFEIGDPIVDPVTHETIGYEWIAT